MKYYLVYVNCSGVPYQVNSYDSEEAQLTQYNKDNCNPDYIVHIVNEVY